MSIQSKSQASDSLPDAEMSDEEVREQYRDVFDATKNYTPDARCRFIHNLRTKENQDRFYAVMLQVLEEQHHEYLKQLRRLDTRSLLKEATHERYIQYLCGLSDEAIHALMDELPPTSEQSSFDKKLIEKLSEEVSKRYGQLSRKDRKRLRSTLREKPRSSFTHYDKAINEAIRNRIDDGTTTDPRISIARLMRLPCPPR